MHVRDSLLICTHVLSVCRKTASCPKRQREYLRTWRPLSDMESIVPPSTLWRAAVPKIIASDLSGFSDSPLMSNHRCNEQKQRLTSDSEMSLSSATNSCVSSAYCACLTLWWSIMLAVGATYSMKNSGPRTEPWGTPYSQKSVVDCRCPTRTNCRRPTRSIHCRTGPVRPKLCLSRRIRVSWSSVSRGWKWVKCFLLGFAQISHSSLVVFTTLQS